MKNSTQNSAKALNLRLNSNDSLNLSKNLVNSNKNSSPKRKTFWPYGILLSLFAIIAACVATIVFALDYPVYEDDSYLQKYQQVDNNFNEIQQKDENFKKNYEVRLNLKPQFDKKNRPFYEAKSAQSLEFSITQKGDLNLNSIKPTLLLTRPHTSEQNQHLDMSETSADKLDTSIFITALPSLEKGRWQLKLKLEKDKNSVGFYEFNLLVSE